MKAILSKAPGLPDTLVLEDVPSPTPKTGEIVISVKAVGVNFPDFLIIQDMYQYKPPRPFSVDIPYVKTNMHMMSRCVSHAV
jgi:NADPH2:quinone reductase